MNVQEIPFAELLEYDTGIHQIPREVTLRECIEQADTAVTAVNDQQHITGYGCIKKFKDTFLLQPLLADDIQTAKHIAKTLIESIPEKSRISILLPMDNAQGVSMFGELGLSSVVPFFAQLLFTKEKFQVPIDKVYSIMNTINAFC